MKEFFDYLGGALQTGRKNSKSGNTEKYVCYFELGGELWKQQSKKVCLSIWTLLSLMFLYYRFHTGWQICGIQLCLRVQFLSAGFIIIRQ
ncbi:MAG: hypothetical protein LKE61_08860 [Erysipelotrichaceae bacterium]|nr:hypothetical protein [Erysipelotrichaceae bacterium]MCI1326316.1 hypothetical protein [Solobacterium sp.]MCH4044034.1 hypothetical protein [Erysipelotrichaceae bacterium]MCH4121249.1 hypothetical protein [Erysipelotrichaceae bacterium]MCI1362881.1 hypothetical protein [Solobacterium sp.]